MLFQIVVEGLAGALLAAFLPVLLFLAACEFAVTLVTTHPRPRASSED